MIDLIRNRIMRNPNNSMLPNFWIDTKEGSVAWLKAVVARGLHKFLPSPLDCIGKGLTRPEAIFLDDCITRYRKVWRDD